MGRYLPTGATVLALSLAVGVLQHVWSWSNTTTNLAAIAVTTAGLIVFWLTVPIDSARPRSDGS